MVWSSLINELGKAKQRYYNTPVKIKRFVSNNKGGFDYEGVQNLKSAVVRGRDHKVCSECGWRMCTCNHTLDEWVR